MTENATLPRSERRHSTVECAAEETSRLMGRRGTLPLMLCSFLFCLLCSFALYGLLLFGASFCYLLPLDVYGLAVADVALDAAFVLLFLIFILPLWLGRLRLGGLLWRGETPPARELFYYFTDSRLLCRAWRIGFVILLAAALPAAVLYMLYAFLSVQLAALPEVLLFLAMAAAAVLLFFLSSFWLLFAALAVGNEEIGVRRALGLSFLMGGRHFFTVARFSLRSMPRFLLGLVTVGVLQILYFTHFYVLSYLRLAMALCPKEEPQ